MNIDIGDTVAIIQNPYGFMDYENYNWLNNYLGESAKIINIYKDKNKKYYNLDIDSAKYLWTEDMFEVIYNKYIIYYTPKIGDILIFSYEGERCIGLFNSFYFKNDSNNSLYYCSEIYKLESKLFLDNHENLNEDTKIILIESSLYKLASMSECKIYFEAMKNINLSFDQPRHRVLKVFKPFEPIIGVTNSGTVLLDLFSNLQTLDSYPYRGVFNTYKKCVPYKANKYKIGKELC